MDFSIKRNLNMKEGYYLKMSKAMFYSKFIEDAQERLNFDYNRLDFEKIIETIKSSSYLPIQNLIRSPVRAGSTPKKSKDKKGDIILLTIKNITRDNKIDYRDLVFVSKKYVNGEDNQNSREYMLLKKGDIIVAITGATIGKIAIFNDNKKVAICSDIAKIETKENINKKFLINFINSSYGQSQIKKLINGSTNFHLSCADIEKVVIPSPKNIDKIMKTNDEFIDLKNKFKFKVEDLNFINKTLLENLKFKLPEKNNKDYFSIFSDLNLLQDRLEFKWFDSFHNNILNLIEKRDYDNFEDIIDDEKTRYGLTASGQEKGKYPFINIENLKLDSTIETKKIKYIKGTEIDEENDGDKELFVREGDILISRSRLVGVASVVEKKDENKKCVYGSYIIKFRIRDMEEYNPYYIALFINSILGNAQTELLKSGSSGYNINSGQIKQIRILNIPKNFQDKIVNVIKSRVELTFLLKYNYDLLTNLQKRMFIDLSLGKKPHLYKNFINKVKKVVENRELNSLEHLQEIKKIIVEN